MSDGKDDELEIDLSKVKSFFSKIGKAFQPDEKGSGSETKFPKSEDEIDVDWRSVISKVRDLPHRINQHKILGRVPPSVFLLLLLLVLQFVPNGGYLPWGGLWMRMQSMDMPQTQGWAANTVSNYYRNQISQQVDRQYPNVPDESRSKLIDETYEQFVDQQRALVDGQIADVRKQFKEHYEYEENGRIFGYLPDIDPYVFLTQAREYLNGNYKPDELHPYTFVVLYSFAKVFSPSINLMQAVGYFPIVFILLSLIPAFYIARRFAGNIGGVFAATMLAVAPTIMNRTVWGHADTDAYQVFFPLYTLWLFIEGLESRSRKYGLIYSGLAGVFMGLYSFAWRSGWWYVFDSIGGAMLIYFGVGAYYSWNNKKFLLVLKENALRFVMFLFATFVVVSLIHGPGAFFFDPVSPVSFAHIKDAAHSNLWPNVYTTVAELNPGSYKVAADSVGGSLLVLIALFGLVLLLFEKIEGHLDFKYAALFLIWFAGTAWATTKGIRFVLLLGPAFSVVFGIAVGLIVLKGSRAAEKEIGLSRKIGIVVLCFAGLLLFFYPSNLIRVSYGYSQNDIPLVNDAWWNSLKAIEANSDRLNAITTSWWDFGHHFRFISDRYVTFDGGSQNTPMAHWVGKSLLTNNESVAFGILRMLDCGAKSGFPEESSYEYIKIYSNRAFDLLWPLFENNSVKTVKVINEIVVENKAKARDILLSYNLKVSEADEILKYTHCDNPPKGFFITSEDMIGKSGVWAHFGGWDFFKADLWINVRSMQREKAIDYLTSKYNISRDDAVARYSEVKGIRAEDQANAWISPWPGYFTGTFATCSTSPSEIVCGNNVVLQNWSKALIRTPQGEAEVKRVAFINEDSGNFTVLLNESGADAGAIVYPVGPRSYASLLMSPQMVDSMFTRLYFFEGHGLRNFVPFKNEKQVVAQFGGWVQTWVINWSGGAPVMNKFAIKKSKVELGSTVQLDYVIWSGDGKILESTVNNWQNLSVDGGDVDLNSYNTSPISTQLNTDPQGFLKHIVGMRLNDVKTVRVNASEIPEAPPQLQNATLFVRVRVRDIY